MTFSDCSLITLFHNGIPHIYFGVSVGLEASTFSILTFQSLWYLFYLWLYDDIACVCMYIERENIYMYNMIRSVLYKQYLRANNVSIKVGWSFSFGSSLFLTSFSYGFPFKSEVTEAYECVLKYNCAFKSILTEQIP